MVLTLTFSFGLVIYRLPMLRARNELDSWTSREAAFLANNWVLLFAAFFVLFATMFPTLSEALGQGAQDRRGAVLQQVADAGRLVLLFLTGVGPLLAWRKSTISSMTNQFLWPTVAGVVTSGGVVCARRAVLVVGSLLRAVRLRHDDDPAGVLARRRGVRRQATGTDVFTALVGLIGRERRRYGGYIVHVGIVLVFLGFAGGGFERDEKVDTASRASRSKSGPYTVRYDVADA